MKVEIEKHQSFLMYDANNLFTPENPKSYKKIILIIISSIIMFFFVYYIKSKREISDLDYLFYLQEYDEKRLSEINFRNQSLLYIKGRSFEESIALNSYTLVMAHILLSKIFESMDFFKSSIPFPNSFEAFIDAGYEVNSDFINSLPPSCPIETRNLCSNSLKKIEKIKKYSKIIFEGPYDPVITPPILKDAQNGSPSAKSVIIKELEMEDLCEKEYLIKMSLFFHLLLDENNYTKVAALLAVSHQDFDYKAFINYVIEIGADRSFLAIINHDKRINNGKSPILENNYDLASDFQSTTNGNGRIFEIFRRK